MKKLQLKDIIAVRNLYNREDSEWALFNHAKNDIMVSNKPSTNETIIYFNTKDLDFLEKGFNKVDNNILNKLYSLPQKFDRRCELEYNDDITKHPIPYVIVRNKDKYFFILREKGSGEERLLGKKGMIGGHIGIEDKSDTLEQTIQNGFMREVYEETHITQDMINKCELKGIIKSYANETDIDHLGLIYEIEINTDNIKAEENGVLSGMWIDKEDLYKHCDSFESWSRCVYNNILKFE